MSPFSTKLADTLLRDSRQFASLPLVELDQDLTVLSANEAARVKGIQPGESLPPPAYRRLEELRAVHRARFLETDGILSDPLCEREDAFRCPIGHFHGFRLAYILYDHSLSGHRALAVLFSSHKESLSFTMQLGSRGGYTGRIQEMLSAFRRECENLQRGAAVGTPPAEELLSLLSASALLTRLVSPALQDESGEVHLCSLSVLLKTFSKAPIPAAKSLILTSSDSDVYLPVDAAAMFLLFAEILRILSYFSLDGTVTASLTRYGEDGEIRFQTVSESASSVPARLFDITELSQRFLPLRDHLRLAEYLAGMQCAYLSLLPGKDTLSLSLYIPKEKTVPDFKSPEEAERYLAHALDATCSVFAYLQKGEPLSDHHKE